MLRPNFGKQRTAIQATAQEVIENRKAITSMATGLREELDHLKAQVGELRSNPGGVGPADTAASMRTTGSEEETRSTAQWEVHEGRWGDGVEEDIP